MFDLYSNFSGLVISWIYLRFYQMHANGSRGDTADGFAFASFFPNVIQPPVAVFGNTIFSLLGKWKWRPFPETRNFYIFV